MLVINLSIWIPIIQGVVTIFALILGTCVAWAGLSTWKDQLNTKAEYDLARRVMIAVYRMRDAIDSARFNEGILDEGPISGVKELQKPMIEKLRRAVRGFSVELLEAEAVWDKTSVNLLKQFKREIADQLIYGYPLYYDTDLDQEEKAEFHEEYHSALFRPTESEYDGFEQHENAIIQRIEQVLKPKLILTKKR